MSFANPWALGLLLALPLGLAIARSRLSSSRRWRETASLLLRGLIMSLLVLALSRPQQVYSNESLATVFLLDVSDSVGPAGREAGLTFIRQALAAMPAGDRAGLILFGAEALVERPVSETTNLTEPASAPRAGYTDIAQAIRLGLTLFPDDTARRLVILSDGAANLGDARQAAQLASANGVEVTAAPLSRQSGPEVRLDGLRLPSTLHQGEEFDLTVQIQSSTATNATLQIFGDGRLVAQQSLSLQPGQNTFLLPLTAGEPGFASFQALLTAEVDTFSQNNSLDAVSQVQGPLSILLVAERPGEGQPLGLALQSAGLAVRQVRPDELPSDLGQLSEAATVVLVNVPAPRLSLRQQAGLQTYVRDLGRGLVVVGGDESYGPGGYFRTALEETLPLEMTIEDEQRLPGMTMLLVIDKSGSMASGGSPQGGGPRKVELAKEAIYRSVELLVPWDQVGVVAFDNAARWVLEPAPAVDRQAIQNVVGTIRASGGTDILAGLQLAAEAMLEAQTVVRHIVLLTDGGANPEGIPELVESLAEQQVTVSVVAIGQGYAPFLEDVARVGGGRFHFADDATVIPQIFAQETSLASRSYIVEETFEPAVVSPSPILQGLTELPQLDGYVATSPKFTAQVILQGGTEGDPLLAQWQYGLGRAVAWTSDAKGQWAADWIGWPEFPRFWSQTVRWTIVEGSGGGVETQVRLAEDRALLSAEFLDENGAYRNNLDVTLNLIDPDFNQRVVSLPQTAPGLYEGAFHPDKIGTYLLRISGQDQGQAAAVQTQGFVMTYSPEYRLDELDATLLTDLATIGGGRVLSLAEPAESFAHTLPPAQGATDRWPWFLTLAVLLLPFDVGLRRVAIGRDEVEEIWNRLGSRLPRRQAAAPVTSSASRLLRIKEPRIEETEVGSETVQVRPPEPAGQFEIATEAQTWVEGQAVKPVVERGESGDEAESTVQRLMRAKQRRQGNQNN